MGIHSVNVGTKKICTADVTITQKGLITNLTVTSHGKDCACSKSVDLSTLIKEYGSDLYLAITAYGDLKCRGPLRIKRLVPC